MVREIKFAAFEQSKGYSRGGDSTKFFGNPNSLFEKERTDLVEWVNAAVFAVSKFLPAQMAWKKWWMK